MASNSWQHPSMSSASNYLFVGNLWASVTTDNLRGLFGMYGTVLNIWMRQNPQGRNALIQFSNKEAVENIQISRPHYYMGLEILTRRTFCPGHHLERDLDNDGISNTVHISGYPAGISRQALYTDLSKFGNVTDLRPMAPYGDYGHAMVMFSDWDEVDYLFLFDPLYLCGFPVWVSSDVMESCDRSYDPYSSSQSSLASTRPANVLHPVNINVFARPDQNLGRARKAAKRLKRAQTMPEVKVPVNQDIDPVTGQSRKRKRVLSSSAVVLEGVKRARLTTEVNRVTAGKRDDRVHKVMESITLLTNAEQMIKDMQQTIERLEETGKGQLLKLTALKSVKSPVKAQSSTVENSEESTDDHEMCDFCFSVIKKRKNPSTSKDCKTAITELQNEIDEIKAMKNMVETNKVGLTNRLTDAKKLLTCDMCKKRKIDFVTMCGHSGCNTCCRSHVICRKCNASVTSARTISLVEKLEKVTIV